MRALSSFLAAVVVAAMLVWPAAAEPTDAPSQFVRGFEEEVLGNYAEAARWYRMAAEQGNANAQNKLGYMYAIALGVPYDYAEAVKWYGMAAEQGYAWAQYNLGRLYANYEDYAEAVRWFRMAAEQGDVEAQNNLGVMYDTGQGVPQDYAEAVKWFRMAADQGDASGQYNIGRMYDTGRGVPQDYAEAAKWFRMAAEQEHELAQRTLGYMYANGEGVPQDFAIAYKWYNLAAALGSEPALKERDRLANLMTAAQIEEAQASGSFFPQKTLIKHVVPDEIRERANEVCNSVSEADLNEAVQSIDINGDERPDWGIEYGAVCGSYVCGTGGCLIELWVTRADGKLRSVYHETVYNYDVYEQNQSRYLVADLHGTYCNISGVAGPCIITYEVNAESLSEVERFAPNAPWRRNDAGQMITDWYEANQKCRIGEDASGPIGKEESAQSCALRDDITATLTSSGYCWDSQEQEWRVCD